MTRIQVGDVCTEANGDEFTVFIDHYANEAPDAVTLDGQATYLTFDPGTQAGRAQIDALVGRLRQAVKVHDQRVIEIYAKLAIGDHCSDIRTPTSNEPRCECVTFNAAGLDRCSRVAHADHHHITVNDDFTVTAVGHPPYERRP